MVIALLVALVLGFASSPARAWASLDMKEWLSRPGVKLVAVEFYATWCKPCMRSVPKWKELHEKYRANGLRLVVVSVQDQGGCAAPDWSPDAVVCDEDGILQQHWKAQELPQAFLWSWQGNLLVARGSVEQVEAAVENYFQRVPRILIDRPRDVTGDPLPDGEALRKMVRTEIVRGSKFDVVADKESREKLRQLRKEGYEDNYDDKMACKLGREVSPNSTLQVTLSKRRNKERLVLELFSIENGCLIGSAKALVMGDLEGAVAEASSKLLHVLVGEVKQPGGEGPPPTLVARPEEPVSVPEPVITSTPEDRKPFNLLGARWFLNLVLAEGLLPTGAGAERTNLAVHAAAHAKWGLLRWEVLSLGLGLEAPFPAFTLATSGLVDLGPFYVRAGVTGLAASGIVSNSMNFFYGFHTSAGYRVELGPSWHLDFSLGALVIPGGDATAVPMEARVGVQRAF